MRVSVSLGPCVYAGPEACVLLLSEPCKGAPPSVSAACGAERGPLCSVIAAGLAGKHMFAPAQQRAAAGRAMCGHHTLCWPPCRADQWLAHVSEALGGSQHIIGQTAVAEMQGRGGSIGGAGAGSSHA